MLKVSSIAWSNHVFDDWPNYWVFEFEECLCLMGVNVGRDTEGPVIVKAWKGKIGGRTIVAQRGSSISPALAFM